MSRSQTLIFEGVSEYEQQAPPRAVVTDESTTTLGVRSLNKELTCPVCLGIIHNTLTVMECLHRFCGTCINKSLRLGKKECPTCRVPVLSRRNMRPDPSFDALIKNLYPNLDEYEAKEEEVIQKINREYTTKSLSQNFNEGIKRQARAKRMRTFEKTDRAIEKDENSDEDMDEEIEEEIVEKKPKLKGKTKQNTTTINTSTTKKKPKLTSPPLPSPPLTPSSMTTYKTRAKPVLHIPETQEIGVVVVPHPLETSLPRLQHPFLRLSIGAKVSHLVKFLNMRLAENITESDVKLILGDFVRNILPYVSGDRNLTNPGTSNGETSNNSTVSVSLPPSQKNQLEESIPPPKILSEDVTLLSLRDDWNRRDDLILMYCSNDAIATV